MATPDSIGTSSCFNCNREVFVRKNSGGFAYFRCEGCGFGGQHHIHRHSEAYIKSRVKLEIEPLPDTGKKPEKAAITPAEKPAASPSPESGKKPEIPAPPAKKQSALLDYLNGDSK